MSMVLKPYPEYKDSGLPWLGKIPVTWAVRRNGRLFAERKQSGFPDLPILEVSLKTGVRIRNFDTSKRKQVMADRAKYKRACKEDIAYNMMRLWQGAVGVPPVDGLISPSYVVARPYADVNSWFYAYLFRTDAYMHEVNQYSHGIVADRNRLYWDKFKQMPSVYAPFDEQCAIVKFLDAYARLVQWLIRAKRRLIELLNEQKHVILQQAVTRGLDPTVRLKPSGIDWLGDVPEHWKEITVSNLAASLQTGPFGSQLHVTDYAPGGTPVINPSHLHGGTIVPDTHCAVDEETRSRLSQHQLQLGDIVLARRGELGRCGLIRQAQVGWLCGTGSLRLRPKNGIFEPEYLLLILSSQGVRDTLKLSSVGSTMDNLNTGMVARVRIPQPPVEEQHAIVNYIGSEANKLDSTVDRAHREIDLLREYHTRLSADVITGKIDVRGMQLPVMDEAEALEDWDTDEDTEVDEMDEIEGVDE